MDFIVLSLPEASYLYMGLAIQAIVRQSSLRWLPGAIVLLWTCVLLGRAGLRASSGSHYRSVAGYVGTSLVILVLFWPEAVPFGRVGTTTEAARVASHAAIHDVEAEVITAADTGHVPETLRDPTLLAPGFSLLLRAITQTPLALAQRINSKAHRTFASLLPMQWLLSEELPADFMGGVGDWTQSCLLPAKAALLGGGGPNTYEDLLPWEPSALRAALTQRYVTVGAQTSIPWLPASLWDPSGCNMSLPALLRSRCIRCDVYLNGVEAGVQSWLGRKTTERGTPLREVFERELGISPQDQARFLIYREMLRAAGPAVPVPSLMASHGVLRGASILGSVLKGWATGGGAKTGAIDGAINELQRAIDGVSWLLGLAVFLTWWGPYIIGLINLVLVGLFPLVVLWALTPQGQFQPLARYFAALLFTASTPLWWALVDVAQRLVSSMSGSGIQTGLVQDFGAYVAGLTWSTMITALGILLIPMVVGVLIFNAVRGIGGLWSGSM